MGNQHTGNRRNGFAKGLVRSCLLMAGLVFGIVSGYAQERTISGVITDGGGGTCYGCGCCG